MKVVILRAGRMVLSPHRNVPTGFKFSSSMSDVRYKFHSPLLTFECFAQKTAVRICIVDGNNNITAIHVSICGTHYSFGITNNKTVFFIFRIYFNFT